MNLQQKIRRNLAFFFFRVRGRIIRSCCFHRTRAGYLPDYGRSGCSGALCQNTEAFGRVLVEAMAAETSVVATVLGGIPEVIEDNKTGLLEDEGDIEGVGTAVLKLLKDAARRREIGRKGRTRVESYFSLEAHVE